MHYISDEATLLERIGAEFFIYQNMVAWKDITDDFDVLNWFQIQQIKFSILTCFAYIIHSVTSLQTENERDFSLAVIYNALHLVNISIEILSTLIFINRNSTYLGRNTPIDVFGVSLDAMSNMVDDTEINLDAFADSIDTE